MMANRRKNELTDWLEVRKESLRYVELQLQPFHNFMPQKNYCLKSGNNEEEENHVIGERTCIESFMLLA